MVIQNILVSTLKTAKLSLIACLTNIKILPLQHVINTKLLKYGVQFTFTGLSKPATFQMLDDHSWLLDIKLVHKAPD